MAKTWRRLTFIIFVLVFLGLKVNMAEAAPCPSPSPTEPIVYIVAPNDTLSAIAHRYRTTVTAIVEFNALTNPDLIFVGQRLTIPVSEDAGPASTTIYTVRQGDTLHSITTRYGTTVNRIAELNGIGDTGLIYVGQRLLLPSASQPVKTEIHIVSWRETLTHIAQKYGTTVSAIAAANSLANPSLIYPGQRLIIPGKESSPITVILEPGEVLQGQTLVVRVPLTQALAVRGSFDGRALTFTKDEGHHWALAGIGAWSSVGPHSLELVVTKPEGITEGVFRTVPVLKTTFPVDRIYLPPGTRELLDPVLVTQERERLNLLMKDLTDTKFWEGLFVVPTEGEISLAFGSRISYNGGPVTSYHSGVDFATPEGSSVVAANNGKVILAEELTVRGGTVFLDHGLGVFSGYFHLSQILVEEGQEVAKGELIGKVGSTGLSSGPHLHWEIRVGGVFVSLLEWTGRLMP